MFYVGQVEVNSLKKRGKNHCNRKVGYKYLVKCVTTCSDSDGCK